MAVVGLLSATILGTGTAASAATVVQPSKTEGVTFNRPVPSAISQIPLVNQHGQPVNLTSWKGKTVVLVPFLTLCTDICPLTTGDFSVVQRSLNADKASATVQLVELSVDPGRDSPARLAAYARLTGASWQLVTETPTNLAIMAKFFGFEYRTVPEGNPPATDWWTGKTLTYAINHSNGYVIINSKGVERFATDAAPNYKGPLDPTIEKFLSPIGHKNEDHPVSHSYTPRSILQALAWTMQRPLAGPKY
jgi:protein SCO1/2